MTLVKVNQRPFGWSQVVDELLNEFPGMLQKSTSESLSFPPVNIHETEEAFHLEFNVPGRKKEDFKVEIDQDLLTLSFEKKEEETRQSADYKTIRREFHIKNFKRSFRLDDKLDLSNIQARYEDGILKLWIPKKAEVKVTPKQINIL